jgi:hypothetical protein
MPVRVPYFLRVKFQLHPPVFYLAGILDAFDLDLPAAYVKSAKMT